MKVSPQEALEKIKNELAQTIEKLKVYEEHLRESREKYRDLFENANDAIFLVDSNFRYIDVNQRAVEIFGFSKDEFSKMIRSCNSNSR